MVGVSHEFTIICNFLNGLIPNDLFEKMINTVVKTDRHKPFITYQVKDILFGAHDELLHVIDQIDEVDALHTNGIYIDPSTGESLNGTLIFNYTLNTGKENIEKYNQVLEFDGRDSYKNIWPSVDGDGYFQRFHGK